MDFKDLKDGLDSLGKVVNVIANKISDKNNFSLSICKFLQNLLLINF